MKERHGEHVWRLGIDAGFSCPHRSADRLKGGCRFCSPDGNIAAYQKTASSVPPIVQQIERALMFTRKRYHANAFLLYFQAYSGTNATAEKLAEIYNNAIDAFWKALERIMFLERDNARMAYREASFASKIRLDSTSSLPIKSQLKGIVVSTRPDCFDSEKAALLATYLNMGMEVWIELGLQSAHAETLSFIRRNHGIEEFLNAMDIAQKAHLRRAVHLMLGLPGESHSMMLETARIVADTGTEGIKFHDFRIAKGSAFARSFLCGEITTMHPSRLPGLLADCLEVLPSSTEIIRISADFRPEEAINIHMPIDKHLLARLVEDELLRRDSCQGQRYKLSP